MLSALQAAREYLTPTLKTSQFLEKGQLTPEEFVQAGDHLCTVSPTWQWVAGDPSKAKVYLPSGKQYLITHRVPCYARVKALVDGIAAKEDKLVEDGSWVESSGPETLMRGSTEGSGSSAEEEEEEDMVLSSKVGGMQLSAAAPAEGGPAGSADDYEDMSALVDPSLLAFDDPAAAKPAGSAGAAGAAGSSSLLVRTRTYDLCLCYDNYYRTPRVFLQGFSEAGLPLTAEQMLEDVYQDYVNKTATLELHPHLPHAGTWISIHPCRHAEAMKKMMDAIMGSSGSSLDASDGSKGSEAAAAAVGGSAAAFIPQVHTYLFLFLKFIASMIPTIEYDFTVAVSLANSNRRSSSSGSSSAPAVAVAGGAGGK